MPYDQIHGRLPGDPDTVGRCGWCGRVLELAAGSHGICQPCADGAFSEAAVDAAVAELTTRNRRSAIPLVDLTRRGDR